MSLRFRLGPFTFGSSGTRLSLWRRGSGISIPLSGKSRSYGKVGFGPFSWWLGESEIKGGARAIFWLLIIAAILGLLLISGLTTFTNEKGAVRKPEKHHQRH